MPIDPIGLTFGVVGLAALFTTCLDCWDFVDAGRSHAKNFSLLRTRLDNQRILFIIWGRKVGFGTPAGYNKRLDDPLIRPILQRNFNHIKLIFSNTDDLVKRYGIKIKDAKPQDASPTSVTPAIFESSYQRFLRTLKGDQQQNSVWKVTRWSIRDEKKFDTMVKNLSDLVGDLDKITSGFISYACSEQMAREEIDTINEIASLEEIQTAAGTAETVISAAASIRQKRIEAATLASGSTCATFFTALDSLGQALESLSIVEAETSQPEPSAATLMQDIIQTNNEAIMATVGPFYQPESADSPLKKSDIHGLPGRDRNIAFMLLQMRAMKPAFFSLAPIELKNLREFLGTFKGPPDSPYDGGVFHIRISLSPDHPYIPPTCWFLTKVYHPNIDEKGAICLDVIREDWSPAMSLETTVISIQSLLESPNTEDPLMPDIAKQLLLDRATFESVAREWTRKYATGEIIYPGTRLDGFSNTTVSSTQN